MVWHGCQTGLVSREAAYEPHAKSFLKTESEEKSTPQEAPFFWFVFFGEAKKMNTLTGSVCRTKSKHFECLKQILTTYCYEGTDPVTIP